MNLFKGYIEADGKRPLSAIKGGEYLTDPPSAGDYVGVLKEDIIQLDFDTEEDSNLILRVVEEKKLKCDVLKTSRGIHLYFMNDVVKSQSVGIFNAMGVKCDIGLGKKDRVIPLRSTKKVVKKKIVNGHEEEVIEHVTKDREWLQTYDELETLPPYFRPMTKTDQGFKTCDTRNQTLFDYILQLQAKGYSREDVRKTIKVINKYMLYEPLSDREIDTITRDDAFSEEIFYNERGTFQHHVFGDYMLANSNIMLVNEQANIYSMDGLYTNDPFEFERQMLDKIPSLKESQRKEVYKYVSLKVTRKGEFAPARFIGLRDSILDISDMSQAPYSPEHLLRNKIPYNYNPNAYHELMDNTLNKVACGDPQIRLLLEEMIGYSLYSANTMQVCFILTGKGSNGKSTLLDLIKKLLGRANYTSLDLRELESPFKPAELYNKLANIGDDISAKYLDNSSVFKKVVTGESFMAERKYMQPFELESYATQIFCANELPQVNDKSDGFIRRIIIVPFKAKFTKNDADYDPFVKDKLMEQDAIEYLLKIAIDGLKRVLMNQAFTKTDEGEKEKHEYNKLNNNVLEWLETHPQIENHSIKDVYLQYSVWCGEYGMHPVKQGNLSKEIKDRVGLKPKPKYVDGKTVRVYVKE